MGIFIDDANEFVDTFQNQLPIKAQFLKEAVANAEGALAEAGLNPNEYEFNSNGAALLFASSMEQIMDYGLVFTVLSNCQLPST